MGKRKERHVIVQAIVSIPRAGEFRVGIPVPETLFEADNPPTYSELTALVEDDARDRLRVKLDKGEHARFVRLIKKAAK